MKKILLITMDDELNKPTDKPMVGQMLESLRNTNVKRAVFYITITSTNLINNIESYYKENLKDEFKLNIVKINDPTNVQECIQAIEKTVLLNSKNDSKHDIMLNYTFGTKSMVMALTTCFHVFTGTLTKNADKYDLGSSLTNTLTQERYRTLNENIILRLVKQNFNEYRFKNALGWLSNIPDYAMYDEYKLLITTYRSVDRFSHIEFPKQLNPNRFDNKIFKQILNNKKAFNILANKKNKYYDYYVLADLINNARRRVEEDKYNDAIARLYRCLDLIKTIQLKKHDVNLYKITKEELNGFNIKNLNDANKFSIYMGFKILNKLDDEVGKYVIEHTYQFNDLINSRNKSILAHGSDSQTEGEYELFYNVVLALSRRICPNITKILSYLEFPKFPINQYI